MPPDAPLEATPVAEVRLARGFAALPPAERKRLGARGGRAAHACGRAHQFSAEKAAAAGRIGGLQVSADRHHMAELGRRGSAARLAGRVRPAESESGVPAAGLDPHAGAIDGPAGGPREH